MAKLTGKALVAQGGGPTAVINQSLVGVVLEARRFPKSLTCTAPATASAACSRKTSSISPRPRPQNLEDVAITPASGLGSTRDKPDVEYCLKMFKVMQAHDIRYFFYVGGNDSSDTCRIVNEQAKATGYDLGCVHVPKTIDNDLAGGTDHCPGFGSAAKFVAQAFAGANMDNRALPGVYIAVVMGRHAGFLTAASALGRKFEDDGPHLIYMPERVFDADKFVADVQKVYAKHGRCIIAVCEGVRTSRGAPIITASPRAREKDAHGNVQLSGTGALGDLLSDLIKAEDED